MKVGGRFGALGPLHVAWRKHGVGLLATGCHMPAHQIAAHKLISHAEPDFRVQQTLYGEVFSIILEVHVRKYRVLLMQPDESDGGGGIRIAIEGLSQLVKWQRFNTVWHQRYGHEVTNLCL